MASESICIGGHENYLSVELLIEAAKKMNCDAIHPGSYWSF
jgi:biotin carboxylase